MRVNGKWIAASDCSSALRRFTSNSRFMKLLVHKAYDKHHKRMSARVTKIRGTCAGFVLDFASVSVIVPLLSASNDRAVAGSLIFGSLMRFEEARGGGAELELPTSVAF